MGNLLMHEFLPGPDPTRCDFPVAGLKTLMRCGGSEAEHAVRRERQMIRRRAAYAGGWSGPGVETPLESWCRVCVSEPCTCVVAPMGPLFGVRLDAPEAEGV